MQQRICGTRSGNLLQLLLSASASSAGVSPYLEHMITLKITESIAISALHPKMQCGDWIGNSDQRMHIFKMRTSRAHIQHENLARN